MAGISNNNNFQKVLILSIGQILEKAIVFFFKPYLSRTLNIQDFGSYSQVLFIGDFLLIFFTLGITQTFYVFLAKDNTSRKEIVSAFLLIGLMSGLLSVACNLILTFTLSDIFKNPELKNILWIYCCYPLFTILNLILQLLLLFDNKSRRLVTINVFVNLFKVICVVIVTQLSQNTLPKIIFIVGFAAPLFTMLLYGHQLSYSVFKIKTSFSLIKKILKDTLPVGLTIIMGGAYFYANGFVVNAVLGIEKYAIFINGIIDIPFISTLYTTIATITLTNYTTLIKDKNFLEVIKLKRYTIAQTASLVYPIALILLFFSEELITTYLSNKYIASVPVFMVYTLILFLRVTDYNDVLITMGKQSLLVKYYTFFFLTIFFNSWLLTKYFGIIGSAFAVTASCYLIYFFLLRSMAAMLNASLSEIINWRSLLFTILISLIVIIPCTLIGHFFALKIWSKLTMIPFVLLIIYMSLVKSKFISLAMYKPLLDKVPFGKKIETILS
ncbi:oligosaccharide flippase family protein [Dyadobacter subterraneus]|uniref:Oligosaccharide flippase family protein n=1 Tax=Dyadobacter subterraneus TaxID=2773304 RepID=A0ABR9WKX8_9BACT|nr:oligosaccharide flippase family protein [Dyadobacter subterraneus]MBE9465021.1 oligosaccharide flippase family protein [Dyadobacter subterraneus]